MHALVRFTVCISQFLRAAHSRRVIPHNTKVTASAQTFDEIHCVKIHAVPGVCESCSFCCCNPVSERYEWLCRTQQAVVPFLEVDAGAVPSVSFFHE